LSENAQGGGNGPSARRQDAPCQQGQDVGPTWLGEQTGKAGEPIHKMLWQRRRDGGKMIKMLHALDKNDVVFYRNIAMVRQSESTSFPVVDMPI
jgi:hypothetical protein